MSVLSNTIYKNVDPELTSELVKFRSTHIVSQQLTNGVNWEYVESGVEAETILVFGGITTTAEAGHEFILEFNQSYRIVSFSYPNYDCLGIFLDDLIELLDRKNIRHFHVCGHSMGAGIAHVLARRYPNRVDKLILSGLGLYNEKNARSTIEVTKIFQFVPYWFISRLYKWMSHRLSKGMEDEKRKAFLAAYLNDLLDLQLDKKALMSQFSLYADIFENCDEYQTYEPIENIDTLIIQAQDDQGFEPEELKELRNTYPQAEIKLFEQGGHVLNNISKAEKYAIIRKFLEQQSL